MKKQLLIYLFLFASVGSLFAQRTMEKREKTEALSVFIDKDPAVDAAGGGQAGAIISGHISLDLSFSSNVDRTVEVYKTEERGDVRYYHLRFIVGRYRGSNYGNRILEVAAPGFAPLKFSLELQPSESKSFEIFDPNATVGVGCFYQHFNEGVELFKKAMYSEAREKYRLSTECTDMPPDVNMTLKIRDLDSILTWRAEGDKSYEKSLFKDAMTYYQKIVSYNIDDEYARSRAKDSENKYAANCRVNYEGAELHYANGDFSEAKKLYEMVVLSSCPRATEANIRLVHIRKIEADHNKRVHAILYEYQSGAPIGITAGAYREQKFAGYVSLRFSPSVFAAMQKDYDNSEKTEFNVSAGWSTMKLQIPVWGFFGLGYTGVTDWDWEDLTDEGNPTFRVHNALSPEVGLLGKLGPIALRYTFQYRFALENDPDDYIGKVKHVFGVGICF